MKNINGAKTPLSIKIIYWVTQIGFWLFVIAGLFLIILGIAVLAGYEPDLFRVNITLPLQFDLVEVGNLEMSSSRDPSVRIVAASGEIRIQDIPADAMKYFSIGWMGLILIVFMVLWYIREFVSNIKKGRYFDLMNIGYLKSISYGIMLIWVYNIVAGVLLSMFFLPNLHFDTIEFTNGFDFNNWLLFCAIFLWALSLIFAEGARIQKDQELTV